MLGNKILPLCSVDILQDKHMSDGLNFLSVFSCQNISTQAIDQKSDPVEQFIMCILLLNRQQLKQRLQNCLDADEMYLLFWGMLHFSIVSKSQCVPLLLGVIPTCCKAKIVQKDMQCFLLTVVSTLVHVKPRGPALFKDHYFNIISLQYHRSTNTYSPGDAVKLLFLIVTLIACS